MSASNSLKYHGPVNHPRSGQTRLALTPIAYLPPKDRVFLIEEPENGIHPRAIEAVFQVLSSVYEGQVFLATHSPWCMALAKPDDLLVFGKTGSGATGTVRGLGLVSIATRRKGHRARCERFTKDTGRRARGAEWKAGTPRGDAGQGIAQERTAVLGTDIPGTC